MAVPQFLGQQMDEAHAVIDRALVERIGPEEAVDIVGAQVGDHLRRRHRADLDILVGIESVLGHVVAQQVVVHRVVEGHGELEALPLLGIALVLVLDRESDRLAVDVLDRRHRVRHGVRADAQRDRERHRRQHVGGVVFLGQRLVADHRPAGRLDHFDVEPLLGIEAHRMGHDDRRGAGDRDEADLEVLFLGCPTLGKRLSGHAEWQHGRDRRHRGGRADGRQKLPPRCVDGENRTKHGGIDNPIPARFVTPRNSRLG